jgi:hypothetical protein
MEIIYFKYNQDGYTILDSPIYLNPNCSTYNIKCKKFSVYFKHISTENLTNNWWEVLGSIEVDGLDNFEEQSVSRYTVVYLTKGNYCPADEIINNVLKIYRRDIKLKLILG